MCGDVALAVLANLVRVIRLRAAGVPLDLDNGLPVGAPLKGEAQVALPPVGRGSGVTRLASTKRRRIVDTDASTPW